MGLLPVAEAHARLMRLFEPLEAEEVPLGPASGRVLARDVVAARAQPPFPASAMDGYAMHSADAAAGARLRVVGIAAAGARYEGEFGPGEAVRIFTGAPVPPDADLIVIQEDVTAEGCTIVLHDDGGGRRNIRAAGSDFPAGARLAAPRRLGPSDLALLAAMNAARVSVARRPVVALIPTGDELVMPGEDPGPDQIVSSNGVGLRALIEAAGGEARLLPIARDTAESLAACFALAEGADLVVTIGGASVGDLDLVQRTALGLGMALDFYKVAMRPGKPLMAGRLGATPLVGLPGNPVSAMVTGRIFLVPAIERMLGLPGGLPETLPARLAGQLGPNGPRAHYMRARVRRTGAGWECAPFGRQDSALLSILAEANALLCRPPDDPARDLGEAVEFLWL
jgi:molybdopterin molybdotransferase